MFYKTLHSPAPQSRNDFTNIVETVWSDHLRGKHKWFIYIWHANANFSGQLWTVQPALNAIFDYLIQKVDIQGRLYHSFWRKRWAKLRINIHFVDLKRSFDGVNGGGLITWPRIQGRAHLHGMISWLIVCSTNISDRYSKAINILIYRDHSYKYERWVIKTGDCWYRWSVTLIRLTSRPRVTVHMY